MGLWPKRHVPGTGPPAGPWPQRGLDLLLPYTVPQFHFQFPRSPGGCPFPDVLPGGGRGCSVLPILQSLAGVIRSWERGLGGETETLEDSRALSSLCTHGAVPGTCGSEMNQV